MDKLERIRRLERAIGDDAVWAETLCAFIQGCDFSAVDGVLLARHHQRGDAASFAFRAALALVDGATGGAWLRRLVAHAPPHWAFYGMFEGLCALDAAARCDVDDAAVRLRSGAFASVQALAAVFGGDDFFRHQIVPVLVRDANLLEPLSYQDGPLPEGAVVPEIVPLVAPPAGRGPLVVASCDGRYFEQYHQRFLATRAACCPAMACLIHVINPTPDQQADMIRLAATEAALGVSMEQGPACTAYYACNRFLIAPRLLDLHQRPLVIVDFDMIFRPGFLALVAAAAEADVGILGLRGETMPASRLSAAFLAVANRAPGRTFLGHVVAYLMRKLGEDPIWMVDQMALFRALCQMDRTQARITDVSAHEAAPREALTSLVGVHQVDSSERSLGRAPLGTLPVSFTPSLKPLYIKGFNVWQIPATSA